MARGLSSESYRLKLLDLSCNDMDDAATSTIAALALHENKTVDTLNLYQKKVGPVGATAIADALGLNDSLQKATEHRLQTSW